MKYIFILFFFLIFSSINVEASIAGDTIIISEVEYDPSGSEPSSEWFELYNPTENDIDISGWEITDGEGTLTFPALTTIGSGEYFLGAHTTATFNGTYPAVTVDLEYNPIDVGSISLANGGDELTLSNGGIIVDFISWEGHTPGWNSIANNGESIARGSSVDTDTEADWNNNQVPTPRSGGYTIIPGPNNSSSSRRKSGSIRYVCKNPQALNYNNTRFARHRNSSCSFRESNSYPSTLETQQMLCKKILTLYTPDINMPSLVPILESCIKILG